MRKRITALVLTVAGLFLLTVIFVACAQQMEKASVEREKAPAPTVQVKEEEKAPSEEGPPLKVAKVEEPAPAVPSEAETKPEKKAPAGAELYEQEVKPLTPAECARCHYPIFKTLKESKSKHRFMCTNCHEKFHRYNPKKQNWDEIMPKCQNCHGLKHGKDFPNCLECHKEPHSPRDINFETLLQTRAVKVKGKEEQVVLCAICHKNESGEMQAHPSKHNEVGCQGCHADKHGYIPNCLDCHEPHVEGQKFEDCLVCHSPHSPKNIKQYPEETPREVCGSCHTEIYQNLQTNHTKHSELYCATCHVRHGQIPKCQDCHGLPHTEALHKKFPNCLNCHIDPHNLPVMNR